MYFVKMLNIPTWILDLLNLEKLELFESVIIGLFGSLVSILGWGFRELFIDNYAKMAGDLTQGSSSPSTNNTSDGDLPGRQGGNSPDGDIQSESESSSDEQESSSKEDEESLSEENRQMQEGGESSSDPQEESSSESDRKNHTAERLTKIFDKYAADLAEEVKNLSVSMNEAIDDDKWIELRDQRDIEIEELEIISKASVEEVKKTVESANNSKDSSSTKRDFDEVEKKDKDPEGSAGSSKKQKN